MEFESKFQRILIQIKILIFRIKILKILGWFIFLLVSSLILVYREIIVLTKIIQLSCVCMSILLLAEKIVALPLVQLWHPWFLLGNFEIDSHEPLARAVL
jgi:hypothetical protein